MIKRILTFVALIRFFLVSGSEPEVIASVLTLDPGEEVYSIFGHTAIRIVNHQSQTDRVYNFGTFDFDDPWFYTKFIRGNLEYFLSVTSFNDFIMAAELENRTVYEQQLAISDVGAKAMEKELRELYHSPEKYYTYDFFKDNCATRVRDHIFKDRSFSFDTLNICCTSFRKLLTPYISNRYWLNLGVNLALGKQADQTATVWDHMFLPSYISTIADLKGITKPGNLLLKARPYKNNMFAGIWSWSILLLIIILQLYAPVRKAGFIFFFTALSLTSVILITVSLLSENPALIQNFNLVWLVPSIAVLAITNRKAAQTVKVVYMILIGCILIFWNQFPQGLSVTFIPWMSGIIIFLAVDLLNQRRKELNPTTVQLS